MDIDDKARIDDISRHDMIGELECALADLVTAGQQYERTLRLNGEDIGQFCLYHDIPGVRSAKLPTTLRVFDLGCFSLMHDSSQQVGLCVAVLVAQR